MKINSNEKIINKYFQYSKLIKEQSKIYKLTSTTVSLEELTLNVKSKYIIDSVFDQVTEMNFHYKLEFDNGVIYISSFEEIVRSKKLEVLVQLANFFYNIASPENKRKLFSYLYLTNLERKINQLIPHHFSVEQVNGGYTNKKENKMVVWRKEDGLKVFIHEMIHFYRLDFYFINNFYVTVNNLAENKICKNDDYVFEAFTDFFAINYYCVYLFLLLEDNDQIIDNFYLIFKKELEFVEKQSIKVLFYANINKNIVDNETNLYCYYLLKYYLYLVYRNKDFFKITKDQLKTIVQNSINYFKRMKLIKPDNDVMTMVSTQIYL